jgi:hypothetical protein
MTRSRALQEARKCTRFIVAGRKVPAGANDFRRTTVAYGNYTHASARQD